MKKQLFSILLILLPTLASAEITWQFDESTGTLTISGTGQMDDYSINYNNLVTTAPWGDYWESIKYVEIENGITTIGNRAFYGCSNITSVAIPNRVTSIGVAAFYRCEKMTSITIPNSVTSIGGAAFNGCI